MINNNINLLIEPPPPAYNLNDEENLEDSDLENEDENNDVELPPYEDNNESEFFLNNQPINIELKKKLFNFIFTFIFIIIYIIFFLLITNPLIINTCKDPIITKNSSCHHDYMCDSNSKCRYVDSCNMFTCESLMGWFYYLIIITCLPSLIILQCLIYLFNVMTKNKYIKYMT